LTDIQNYSGPKSLTNADILKELVMVFQVLFLRCAISTGKYYQLFEAPLST